MLKIFDLSLKLNGFPLEKARRLLLEILLVPEAQYESFIEQKKKEIVAFHLEHNSFYRDLAKDFDGNWESLPIMRKIDFQRPLVERLSDGYTPKSVYQNKTSGSSGDPMVFARDKMAHALTWANISRRFGWYGIDFNHSWQARFYGMTLDFIDNKKLRLKDYLSKRYRFSIFDLSDDALEKVVDKFRSKKFSYINGYTSPIVLLAKYLKKKNLILKDICPSLKVCIVTSEMLFEDDHKLLEDQFGVPVINEYGASELEVIAFENTDNEWIVNSETVYVEILDENNKPVPYGQEGRIVVTSLFNKAHPFIRYEVGDFGILDEKSTAKKPLLKKLTGRTNDFAILPSGKKPAGMTFYSITKKLFDDDGNVKEFVIRQTQKDIFEINYTSERVLTETEMKHIEKVMGDYLEPGLQYIFNRKDVLERSSSGKLKQFVSLVRD
ncbi:phenylacetate--CoA ligase family protein [Flavobacterium silvaticum]|uniref:Phenylacetate--CoA ligase family protein n=1 Tax=Flavobacterium silvaticum TaxID=1852020 RepID=A0A972JJR8_9FLAO|nr:phenylacetate--CoA ligase family protein [Flavobacterium silvaticum]NMH28377.1 phenylacetate--CoA ligase family protein [Flavobacterium silvaticum]